MSSKVQLTCNNPECRHSWLGKPPEERSSELRCPKCRSRRIYYEGKIEDENGELDNLGEDFSPEDEDYFPPVIEIDSGFEVVLPDGTPPPERKKKEKPLTARQMHELKKRSKEGMYNIVYLVGLGICAWRNWIPPSEEEVSKLSTAYLNLFPTETGVGKALKKVPIIDAVMLTIVFFMQRIFSPKLVKDQTRDLKQGEPEPEPVGSNVQTPVWEEQKVNPFKDKMGTSE